MGLPGQAPRGHARRCCAAPALLRVPAGKGPRAGRPALRSRTHGLPGKTLRAARGSHRLRKREGTVTEQSSLWSSRVCVLGKLSHSGS